MAATLAFSSCSQMADYLSREGGNASARYGDSPAVPLAVKVK
jgi:hypothetical protein